MAIEPKTLRSGPPHDGHSDSGASLNDWYTSWCSPHSLHAYS
jgi:hypothetical protein